MRQFFQRNRLTLFPIKCFINISRYLLSLFLRHPAIKHLDNLSILDPVPVVNVLEQDIEVVNDVLSEYYGFNLPKEL